MALQEAQRLARRFAVIAAVPEGPLRPDFEEIAHVIGGPVTVPLGAPRIPRLVKQTLRTLLDVLRWMSVLRTSGAELVITNSTVVVAPVLAARMLGVPSIVHARDVSDSWVAQLVLGLHKRMASTIVAISASVQRALGHARAARIVCIHYGVESVQEPPRPKMPNPGALSLAVVGTVERRKGQDVALEAVGLLRARGLEARLALVGREQDPGFASALRARAIALGVADNLQFVGSVADVGGVLETVDIVLGPSRAEPLGLALMEAMALGKPVVASRVDGIPEFIEHEATGLLVAPEAPEELADAIGQLVADPHSAQALGAAARQRIIAQFTLEETMRAYEHEVDLLVGTIQGASEVRPVSWLTTNEVDA